MSSLAGYLDQVPTMVDQLCPSLPSVGPIDDRGDISQRHTDIPQCSKGARSRELAKPVTAVTGAVIDLDRHEQTDLVVMAQRLDRQPCKLRERTDTNQLP